MGLVLDTSILIASEREKFDLAAFLRSSQEPAVFMSSVTLSELWHGYHRGKGPKLPKRLQYVNYLETQFPVLEFGVREALVHAKVWADLEKIGQGIGLHDLIIAATALTHAHSIATLNESDFRRVPGLRLIPVTRFVLK